LRDIQELGSPGDIYALDLFPPVDPVDLHDILQWLKVSFDHPDELGD
jgi:hypothetical protein